MDEIQYTGLDQIEAKEKAILDTLSTEYFGKLKRGVHNELKLNVHIKKSKSPNGRALWSIHIHANAPTQAMISDKAEDWDFARTLHKAFNDLETQIEKKWSRK